jgi:hypothetical protein
MTQVHEEYGHRGIYAIYTLIKKRFYRPEIFQDVKEHVKSCHECQVCSTKKVEVPLTISEPEVGIFRKVYIDTMVMPAVTDDTGKPYRYIVGARCDLTQAAEGRALRVNDSESLAQFLFEEIICRYGAISQVVIDNKRSFPENHQEIWYTPSHHFCIQLKSKQCCREGAFHHKRINNKVLQRQLETLA